MACQRPTNHNFIQFEPTGDPIQPGIDDQYPPHANRRDHKGIWRLYLKGHEARMRGIPLGLLALPYLVAQPVFPEVHVWLTLEAVTSTHVGHEQVVVGIDIHMADQFAF